MSSAAIRAENTELIDKFEQFYRRYYDDEIRELAASYPNDTRSLYVDWMDLYKYDADLPDDYLAQPEQLQEYAEEALRLYDLPADIDLGNAHVRVTNLNEGDELNEGDVYGIGALRADQVGNYVGIRGQISRVTGAKAVPEEAAFECQRCGSLTYVTQSAGDFQEPHECKGCERQGPFQMNFGQSKMVDQRKVLLRQPPGEASGTRGQEIEIYVKDDLVDVGGSGGLPERAGEDAIVYGILQLEQMDTGGRGGKSNMFDDYLNAHAFEFLGSDAADVEVKEHEEEFKRHANSENPIERFTDSMAPQIKRTPQWGPAFKMGAAVLFGAPRLDPPDGPTYRGDIHMAIFGDPGLAKSVFTGELADISPDAERRSATGLSSDVGLTAAAVKDDFGDGQFTLKPGILVRAGWHAVIDEIDKGPEELVKMNDALEGDQLVTVDKGGISAKLESRTSLIVTGNPRDGRFDKYEPIAAQIDVDPSLISRFDGVVLLADSADENIDTKVADHITRSYQEAVEMEHAQRNGKDVAEAVERDATKREVDKEVLRAWVKYARENIFPRIPDEVMHRLRDFYVDVRQMNGDNDDTIPATARKLETGLRFSMAFARLRLSETVEIRDAEEAISLSKSLIGQTFNPETGTFDADKMTEATDYSMKDRMEKMASIVGRASKDDPSDTAGATIPEVLDRADDSGISQEKAEGALERMLKKGDAYKPDSNRISLS